MTEDRTAKVREQILALVPKDGSAVGNVSILSELSRHGISEQEYNDVKRTLFGEGVIQPGRGRGGSIKLSSPVKVMVNCSPATETAPAVEELPKGEKKRLKKLMLEKVPKDGSTIGNKALMSILKRSGFTEDLYWALRNELIEEGVLAKGRGLGGSVHHTQGASTVQSAKKIKESALYDPFRKAIDDYWIQDNKLVPHMCIVEKIASGGKKGTGKWTKPDVVVVSVQSYQYVPAKFVEVISFEIKPAGVLDVSGVFETASHSKYAHRSYLAIHMPNGPTDDEKMQRLLEECERFGIGFMYFKNPGDWATYETKIEPRRQNPAPPDVNDFITFNISRAGQNKIVAWL
ncbi:MAG: hypothetical protein ABIJ61_04075 [bacterium]